MDMRKKLHEVPSSPGIYIMKGAKDKAIYVGKAKNLKNRLRSYFYESSSLETRKLKMMEEVKSFDYVVTKNELEALVLEANFIKRIRPRYNIVLRDDKNYPYLRLTIDEQWPRLEVTRRIEKDGSLYFGPYVPAGTMWETLKFIRRNFPLRSCRYDLARPMRPCVQYQIDRCLAPCAEARRTKAYHERYMEIINEVKLFLQGDNKALLSHLQERMQGLSDELRFEEAAQLRDRLKAIQKAWETQRVVSPELGDMDVIGLHRGKAEASVFVLFVRNGMVIGQNDFFLAKLDGIKDAELISNFIEQFYSKEMLFPSKIILPVDGKFKMLEKWLGTRRGASVKLAAAKTEQESDVMKMASDNAYHSFSAHREIKTDERLAALKNLLNLKAIPKKIEAIDVSNITGSEAVGALVAWEDGKFVKKDYRLFKIKTVEGIDDFAMIGEVAGRHFKDLADRGEKLPQLFLIDGGRGQLESVLRAVKQFKLPVETVSIAKARAGATRSGGKLSDRIYLPGRADSIPLDPFTTSTHLLQRIRDEAHRFAVNYHKKLRAKRVLESPLEKIRGIGKTRRLILLRHFGSLDAIRKASLEEIASLKGMSRKVAELLKASLN